MSKRRQAGGSSEGQKPKVARYDGGQQRSQDFSRLDSQTTSYFTEVRTTLDTLEDAEERSLLAANALEETAGREIEVSSDAACSRVLEVLLGAASGEAVLKFAHAVLTGDNLLTLATNPFGSHVAERLLNVLAQQVEEAGLDTTHPAYKVLEDTCAAAGSKLYDLVTNRYGSHVARQLLVVAAGYDITPAQVTHDGAEATRTWKGKGGHKTGLAAKVHAGKPGLAAEAGECRYPELLQPFTEAMLSEEYASSLAEEFPFHPYASPFLQAFLCALRNSKEPLRNVIFKLLGVSVGASTEDGTRLEELPLEHVHGIMQERVSSHVLEVVLSVAPEPLRAEIFDRFLRGYLAQLALHPVANFVVQAALAAVRTTPEMKGVVKELRGSFPELLHRKRGGVVAAALAAAARTGAGQVDLGKALSASLRELPGNTQGPAAALLTLDLTAKLDSLDTKKRLSTLGCTMLSSVFTFVKEASGEFVDSLLDLSPGELVRVAADPGGSRVLEAFLVSKASAKLKKKLLKKLQGSFGAIALTPGGNFFVENCYIHAGMKDKEAIAGELAKAEMHLSSTPRGMKLLNRCGVSEYKKNSDVWRNRIQTSAAMREEFADLLGEEPGGAAAQPAAEDGSTAAAAEPASRAEDSKADRKKRRQKGQQEGDILAELTVGSEAALKKKGKKRKEPPANPDKAGEGDVSTIAPSNAASEPAGAPAAEQSPELQAGLQAPKRKKAKKVKKDLPEAGKPLEEAIVAVPEMPASDATPTAGEAQHSNVGAAAEPGSADLGVQLLDVYEDRSRTVSAERSGGSKQKKRSKNGKGVTRGPGKVKKKKKSK